MGAEADTLPGASWGRRSVKRVNSRNGYRSRRWDIPAGTVELEISKLRSGRPLPRLADHAVPQAETAPVAAIADGYLAASARGGSTSWWPSSALRDLKEPGAADRARTG